MCIDMGQTGHSRAKKTTYIPANYSQPSPQPTLREILWVLHSRVDFPVCLVGIHLDVEDVTLRRQWTLITAVRTVHSRREDFGHGLSSKGARKEEYQSLQSFPCEHNSHVCTGMCRQKLIEAWGCLSKTNPRMIAANSVV